MPLNKQYERRWVERDVPMGLRLRLLLGGALNQVAFFILGFGGIFFWVFAMHADVNSMFQFRGQLVTVKGSALDNWATPFTVGGDDHHSGTPVYGTRYAFTAPDGKRYEGTSYGTGRVIKPDQSVVVEYPKGRPEISRIQGMRREILGAWAVFPVIFPAVSFVMLYFGLRAGLRRIRLLREGRLADGTLIRREMTSTRINNRPVYKLFFEFAADGRKQECVTRTHRVENLSDGSVCKVLFDPHDPTDSLMLDSMPVKVVLDANGRITDYHGAWHAWILPLIVIAAHGTYIRHHFFT